MFRRFAGTIPGGANEMFRCHPSVLTTLLEVAWQSRANNPDPTLVSLGAPGRRSNLAHLPDYWLGSEKEPGLKRPAGIQAPEGPAPFVDPDQKKRQGTVLWDHLIYAYMIENTRIYEIFRRVLYEFLHGEKLGAPTPEAQDWLRNTEELFYRDPTPFSMTTITSHIRPDLRATRRNAYWRMFGMDLNHGTDDSQPYGYIKADAYNNEFVTVFEEFLREAWVAIANRNNTAGTDPTDPTKMENLAGNLQSMLMSRRSYGNLSREEFVAVSMMSWFHLTVAENFPIIEALSAQAASPEQRLFKVAQRVGLPAHGLSKSFFDIADPISRILTQIEADGHEIVGGIVEKVPTANDLQRAMGTIITHWSIITGRDAKAGKVAVR